MKDILDFKRILLTDKYEVLQFPSYGDEIGYIVIEDMFRQQTKEEFESFLGIVDNSFEAADNFILVKVGVIRDLEENEQENINRLIDRLLGYLPDNYYFVDYQHMWVAPRKVIKSGPLKGRAYHLPKKIQIYTKGSRSYTYRGKGTYDYRPYKKARQIKIRTRWY